MKPVKNICPGTETLWNCFFKLNIIEQNAALFTKIGQSYSYVITTQTKNNSINNLIITIELFCSYELLTRITTYQPKNHKSFDVRIQRPKNI